MFPFIIFLSASSPIIINNPCPVIQPVKNFNLSAFAIGFWYEIARYPGDFEKNEDCVVVEFKPEKEAKKYRIAGISDQQLFNIDGSIELAKDANDTGAITLYSNAFVDTKGVFPVIYFLDVDYDQYYIAYQCKYDAATNSRKDFAWISTRNKTVDPATKAKIDDFLKSTDQNAHPIIANKLVWLHFTEDACRVVKT